eukprot:scaffold86309_cov33-Phaeocystis_antarctica.AAC.2
MAAAALAEAETEAAGAAAAEGEEAEAATAAAAAAAAAAAEIIPASEPVVAAEAGQAMRSLEGGEGEGEGGGEGEGEGEGAEGVEGRVVLGEKSVAALKTLRTKGAPQGHV